MRSSLFVENPDSIEMTVTTTLTLEEWKRLKEQLEQISPVGYPSNQLIGNIRSMVLKAEDSFYPDAPQKQYLCDNHLSQDAGTPCPNCKEI